MSNNPHSTPAVSQAIASALEQSLAKVLQLALQQHQAGQHKDAADLYQSILQIQPDHAEANLNLGILAVQRQQPAAGLAYFKAALVACPEEEPYWLSYIDALLQAGENEVARQILTLGRQNGLAGDALDKLAERLGPQPQQALITTLAPGKPQAQKVSLKDLAKAPGIKEMKKVVKLFDQGRIAEVEPLARSLVARFPRHGFGWKVQGAVHKANGRAADALQCMQQAAEWLPNEPEAHYNLGSTLLEQRQLNEAAVSLRQAVALNPGYAVAHGNLGNTLYLQGLLLEAEASLRRSLALQPDAANTHCSLALTLQEQGRLPEAAKSYQRALEIEPDFASAHSNLLFCLSHDVMVDAQQLYSAHLAFGAQFEAPLRAGWQSHSNVKDTARCLQVGFVSGDLCNHAVASFLEPVLEFLSRKQGLSLHAYYTYTIEDVVTQRLRSYFAHWHAVAQLDDAELAQKIRGDGIDILIDLSGHTGRNRLLTFARKPAPIQVSWIGYPGTTGLQAMDYYLCNLFFIPKELAWQFTEKLAYMPSPSIFQPSQDSPAVNALPALENGFITFGSFNRANKLNDATIALWCLLLRAVPNAQMVLAGLSTESKHGLSQRFAQNEIDPNRLTFCPRTGIKEYLALHHEVDLCLDTFPYGGGTTTCHAAWMGVPTLTLTGETPASRGGVSIMGRWGLTEFVAKDIDDFVAKGVHWSTHLNELADIRMSMREHYHVSAIGRADMVTNHLDAALRTMWQRWCGGLPPEAFEVCLSENGSAKPSNNLQPVPVTTKLI